jgi:hypothetical protein
MLEAGLAGKKGLRRAKAERSGRTGLDAGPAGAAARSEGLGPGGETQGLLLLLRKGKGEEEDAEDDAGADDSASGGPAGGGDRPSGAMPSGKLSGRPS